MNDPRRLRALLPVSVHMAHDIVADKLLALPCHLVVDVLGVRSQLVDLLLGDDRLSVLTQSQLHLCLRQGDPEPSPCAEFHIL